MIVKSLATLSHALAIAFVLSACGPADNRRPLVVYSPHGKEMLSHYEKAFEKYHPDIDVQWIDMGGQMPRIGFGPSRPTRRRASGGAVPEWLSE